jgi:hypothetical protein
MGTHFSAPAHEKQILPLPLRFTQGQRQDDIVRGWDDLGFAEMIF